MSRTFKQLPAAGKEYWSPRPSRTLRVPGPFAKKITHRQERRNAVRQIATLAQEAA